MVTSVKFWEPLSLGKALLIFLITHLAMQLVCVALREGLGWAWANGAAAGGAGGFLGVVIVGGLARQAQARNEQAAETSA